MNACRCLPVVVAVLATVATQCGAEVQVKVAVNRGDSATPDFQFDLLPKPSSTDAGNLAKIRLVRGDRDSNSASTNCLVDGALSRNQDDPSRNFFLTGNRPGRLLFDLGKPIDVRQVNTYSWHPQGRGPQVYTLYAATGDDEGFNPRPRRRRGLEESGWTRIAEVDTRPEGDQPGGQYAVSVRDSDGAPLGKFRYLLFEVSSTADDQAFSNTFFSEIDVVDGNEYPAPVHKEIVDVLKIGDEYQITFDMTDLPEIREFVVNKLKPICAEWYPKIVDMLPSDDYKAPKRFAIYFHSDMGGVAYTSGVDVHCAGVWFMRNLNGEAAGAVVHELVHVVQQYRGRRGRNRNPGWMVEGLADYIRWFLYEPEEVRPRPNPSRSNFDDSYRTTGAFLNFVIHKYDPQLHQKFNTAMREGNYDEELWVKYTGKSPPELWAEYVQTLEQPAAAEGS